MRIFDKVLTLALLLAVCPSLVNAKIYKIEDYKKQRTFGYTNNRINCADLNWDIETCENRGGILLNAAICSNRGRAGNGCICPNDYIEVKDNITLNPNFEYNNRTIITLTDKDNNTKYCVPEPKACSDRRYVMTEVLSNYINQNFNISMQSIDENDRLSITTRLAGISYTINNSDDSPVYQFTVNNMTYYCAPNNPGSYDLSYEQPATVQMSAGESNVDYVSLSDIPTTNTHAAQSTIDVGGLLNALKLHYLSGCQTGWNLAINREPNALIDCSNGQGVNYESNGGFTYIANRGQYSGYCYKCTGCANGLSGTPGHYTLLGDLEGSNVSLEGNNLNTEAFTSGDNCAVLCNTGWTKLYVGPEDDAPFTRDSLQKTCIGGTGESRCGGETSSHFRYEIATLTKQSDNARYIQVCVKANGCNIEEGYIGGCQHNCWKSFFSTQPKIDITYEQQVVGNPNNGGNDSCGDQYVWDASNCLLPKEPGGTECGGKFNACTCPSEYNITTCNAPKVGSIITCNGKYNSCECPESFKWDETNCVSPNVPGLGGSSLQSCDHKYDACGCPDDYQYDSNNCQAPKILSEPCTVLDEGSTKYRLCVCPIYDGATYTAAINNQLGCNNQTDTAACKAHQYYPAGLQSNSSLGEGKWYLPAVLELEEIRTSGINTSSKIGSVGSVLNGAYWSSSEFSMTMAWRVSVNSSTSNYSQHQKYSGQKHKVRPVLILDNELPAKSLSNIDVQVGDVVYSDLTYDSYTYSHPDKTPIGMVYWVSGNTVRIVSLGDISGSYKWGKQNDEDISGIPNMGQNDMDTCHRSGNNVIP